MENILDQQTFEMDLQLLNDYNNIISRGNAEALIPEEVAQEIIQGATEQSAIMRMAMRAPDISTNQKRVPVLNALPTAYFVDGEAPSGGLKKTTQMAWENKFFNVEEMATIIPIPEAVLDDSSYDIWGQVRPRIEEAMGVLFDRAVLFGESAPATWPTAVLNSATAAGNVVALGTGADIYDDIMGEDGVLAKVEEDGYGVNGHVAAMNLKSKLRGLRTSEGLPIFNSTVQETTRYSLDGEAILFPRNGSVLAGDDAVMFSGDFNQLMYAIRQDITYKVLDQAVITDENNNIIYNLAQKDMVALRVVMRLAWQVPNPVNRLNHGATRYPFAALTSAVQG